MRLFNNCSAIVSSIPTEKFRYFIITCQGTKYVSGHKRVWHKRVWPQTYTFMARHDCDHTIKTCQGTIMSGHKRVWVQTCVGTNVSGYKRVWAQTSGHKRVWAQTCLDTNVWAQSYMFVARHDCDHTIKKCQGPTYMSGHKRVWVQTCVGTNVSGHKREWAKTCGHKRVWAQNVCGHKRGSGLGTNVSGHNRVDSSMFGHKILVSDCYIHVTTNVTHTALSLLPFLYMIIRT